MRRRRTRPASVLRAETSQRTTRDEPKTPVIVTPALPSGSRLGGVLQSADGFGPSTAAANTAPVTPDSHDVLNYYIVNRTVLPTLTQTQVNVPLDQPGSNRMPRVTQLDFSVAKSFH